jgi:hypothetical protein
LDKNSSAMSTHAGNSIFVSKLYALKNLSTSHSDPKGFYVQAIACIERRKPLGSLEKEVHHARQTTNIQNGG